MAEEGRKGPESVKERLKRGTPHRPKTRLEQVIAFMRPGYTHHTRDVHKAVREHFTVTPMQVTAALSNESRTAAPLVKRSEGTRAGFYELTPRGEALWKLLLPPPGHTPAKGEQFRPNTAFEALKKEYLGLVRHGTEKDAERFANCFINGVGETAVIEAGDDMLAQMQKEDEITDWLQLHQGNEELLRLARGMKEYKWPELMTGVSPHQSFVRLAEAMKKARTPEDEFLAVHKDFGEWTGPQQILYLIRDPEEGLTPVELVDRAMKADTSKERSTRNSSYGRALKDMARRQKLFEIRDGRYYLNEDGREKWRRFHEDPGRELINEAREALLNNEMAKFQGRHDKDKGKAFAQAIFELVKEEKLMPRDASQRLAPAFKTQVIYHRGRIMNMARELLAEAGVDVYSVREEGLPAKNPPGRPRESPPKEAPAEEAPAEEAPAEEAPAEEAPGPSRSTSFG